MSTLPENEFDLEKLFLPAWAQEPSSAKQYAKYEGGSDRFERRDDRRGPRPPRRDGPPGGRRPENRGAPTGDRRGPRRDGPPGGRPPGGGASRPEFRRRDDRERRPAPAPLPELEVNLVPDEKGVESLARQVKMTGRAYPLFDIAQMILQKPERHSVGFKVKKNAEGKAIQPLFVCALDDTLWLSEAEAVEHVIRKHFTTFYTPEKTATEPPKGKYTFVGQCGISGVVLGPPNYHDYQNQLRKLHTDRFSRMPFEEYKGRVKIVRDEEVVKKWVEDQSWRTEYICLNLPEPLRLTNMEAVEKHFREVHKDTIIKSVDSHTMGGAAARNLRSPELQRLVRSVWEDQRRFPLQIATVLSQQFASHGLQFFKVNKTLTHVSVARPHYLDMVATPVSEGVKRIVDFIDSKSKCNRRELVEALAPSPAPVPAAPGAEAASNEPTPEQTAIIADLHWLVHQGHVIEFANGNLETAKKPLPKPPRPEAKPKAAAASPAGEAPATKEPAPSAANAEAAPAAEPIAPESFSSPEGAAAGEAEKTERPSPIEDNSDSPPAGEANAENEVPAQSQP